MTGPMRTRGDLQAPRPWSPSVPDPDEPREPRGLELRPPLNRVAWLASGVQAVGWFGVTVLAKDHPWLYIVVAGGAVLLAAMGLELVLRLVDRRGRADAD